jgi:hypothetical protein
LKQIFDIDTKGNVFLQDNTIALCPAIWKLYKEKGYGSDAVRWIVMMHDYKSPYRKLPEAERERTVTYRVFNTTKHSKIGDKIFQDAIEEYRKLQYDPLLEQYRTINQKLQDMDVYIKGIDIDEKGVEKLQKILIGQEKVVEAREKLKETILKNEEQSAKIEGGTLDDMSILEREQRDNDAA